MNERNIPRVLMLTAEYGPLHVGGLGSFLTALCKGMDKTRFLPVVALPRSNYEVPWDLVEEKEFDYCKAYVYCPEGVEVWLLSNAILDQRPIFLPTSQARIKKFDDYGERVAELLEAMRVDIVHLHDSFGYKCLYEAQRLGQPTIFTVHRLHMDLPNEFFAEIVCRKLADVVTTVGRSYAEENPSFFDQEKIIAIPNGIDPEYWNAGPGDALTTGRQARRQALLADLELQDRTTFAYVGRLDPDQKGLDVLLDAYRNHLATRDFNLIVAGDGSPSLAKEFQSLAGDMPDRVKFLGRSIARDEVRRIMGAVDFAILPSRYEPFGIVQLEAMAMGAVPIASATGGHKDVIVEHSRPDGFGRLFPNGDGEALAMAIEEMARLLLDQPARVSDLRVRASAMAHRYSHRVMASRYENLYSTILDRRSSR